MANMRTIDSSRMGEINEGKLLLSMAVPIMLSMLVQALYNVVDSIFTLLFLLEFVARQNKV